MATNLNVTELDFADIKNNLKNFLKQQTEFNDYDFDGSGLNVLLDVLAYNTHYNALNAHYSLNESFLDSAQIRGNVVTRAKLLSYTPRSVLSPRATVDLVVNMWIIFEHDISTYIHSLVAIMQVVGPMWTE